MDIKSFTNILQSKKDEAQKVMETNKDPEINNALNWLLPEMFAEQIPKVVDETMRMFITDLFDCAESQTSDYDCSIDDTRIKIATTIAHEPVSEPDLTDSLMFFANKQVTKENRLERILKREDFKNAYTKAMFANVCDFGYHFLLGCVILNDTIQMFVIPINDIKYLSVDLLRESTIKVASTINSFECDIKKVKFYNIVLNDPTDRKNLLDKYYIGGIKYSELCWATKSKEEILEFLRYMLNNTLIASRMPKQIRDHLIKTIQKYVEENRHE